MPGLIVLLYKAIWLLSLLFVFGFFIVGLFISLKASFEKINIPYMPVIAFISGFFSWVIVQYSQIQIFSNYTKTTVFASSEFFYFVWNLNVLYFAAVAIVGYFVYYYFKSRHYWLSIIFLSVALIGFFAGSIQVFIGLFFAKWYFLQHGVESCVWC